MWQSRESYHAIIKHRVYTHSIRRTSSFNSTPTKTISFYIPIATVELIVAKYKATESNWLNLIVVNQ